MRSGKVCGILLLAFFWINQLLVAQTTGTVLGTVSDSTGAVIPGAMLTTRNTETGISRTATTDSGGRYLSPQLGIGNYEVVAEAPGFQTVVRSGINLTVGREARVDFTLQVGAVAERITVTGEAPLIETTSSSVGGLVNEAQMKELPLNARSYEQLATIQPTVYWVKSANLQINNGWTPRLSAAGMRTTYNSYWVDGIDPSDISGGAPGSAAGQLLGVETLREFRVLTNNYPAQYGRAMGGVIEVASRSGTNDLHGTIFEFLRNDIFDARSYFDEAKPALRRNQFGGVLGGPIVQDKAFYFGSYEAFRERNTITDIELVPTLAAKTTGDLGDGRFVTVNPAVKPWLDVYPAPTKLIGGGVGTVGLPYKTSIREDFFTGRVDYQWSPNVQYFARYQGDTTTVTKPRGPGNIPLWGETNTTFSHIAVLGETRILTPQLINEFRAGFVRSNPTSTDLIFGTDPNLRCPPAIGNCNIQFGQSYYYGQTVARIGSFGRSFENYTGNTFQVTDNMSYAKGVHSLKWGFNLERFRDNVLNKVGTGPYRDMATYNFNSMSDLLQGNARTFSGALNPAIAGISGRMWLYGFYVQDDYRLFPNFTLNLGVRYEKTSNYRDVLKRFQVLQYPGWETQTTQVGREYLWDASPCKGCIEPRFGWAWDVFSNSKSVLKGGFGVFHNQITRLLAYYPASTGAPGSTSISVDFPVFGAPTTPRAGTVIRITESATGSSGASIQQKIPTAPTALHWNLTLDQQLATNMTFRLGYVGSRGYHLDGGYTANTNKYEVLPDGTIHYPDGPAGRGLGRIQPKFGSITYQTRDFTSYYNALTATLGQRISRGLSFEASYSFSRVTDDTSVGGRLPANQVNEPENIAQGKRSIIHGLSALSLKHRGVINANYQLPSFNASSAFASKLVSGWQLNTIITLQSGVPLTPVIGVDQANSLETGAASGQRPNYNPATHTGPIPICPCTMPAATAYAFGTGVQDRPQRYFDPTVFSLPKKGYYGDVGRGVMLGPGTVNFDLSFVKNTPMTERLNLQFRAEAFNVFNNVNFGNPNTTIFADATGAFTPAAGLITTTTSTGRQIQFALKLLF
ncbi:MAG: TonB-dependent receptor [Acidobacteria bacterium]|nr:TonB-dependent receptor [Acidobacteriota bacterium]